MYLWPFFNFPNGNLAPDQMFYGHDYLHDDWLDSRLKTLYVTILREVGKRMESLLPELDLFKKGAVTVALYKSTG